MSYSPNAAEVEKYREDGYLVFHRPIFSAARFEWLKNYLMGKLDQAFVNAPTGAPAIIDCPHWQDPAIFEWLLADEMLDLVEPLIGSDIGIFACHLLQKPPGVGKRVPWHEDSAYWKDVLKPMEVASVTLALGPSVKENGCLRVIAGSHRHGYSDYEQVARPEDQVFPIEIKKNQCDEAKAVDIELQPNEASIHHVKIIHGSNPNTGTTRRAVFTVRYFPTHVKLHRESHPYFSQRPFHIFLARGRDKAGNTYSEPGKTNDVLQGVSTA
jgi:ectoine hydroxylase-related dioxygenase (phytanoyl-CoA dioxygenase family)